MLSTKVASVRYKMAHARAAPAISVIMLHTARNKLSLLICILIHFSIMNGGAKTGFHHVEPDKYQPRLLHFFGERKNITVQEVGYKITNTFVHQIFFFNIS